jgi:hypothetical protein
MVPDTPISRFGDYDWFLSSIRAARIQSVAYTTIFSVSASQQSTETLLKAVESVRSRLETWRMSIPMDFRPKEPIDSAKMTNSCHLMVALETHCTYYELNIALERVQVHIAQRKGETGLDSQLRMVETARTIIELAQLIPIAPNVPLQSVPGIPEPPNIQY